MSRGLAIGSLFTSLVGLACIAGCSANIQPTEDGNGGSGAGTNGGGPMGGDGTGANGGMQQGPGPGGGGSGGSEPFSCDQCTGGTSICVDDASCAATCPDQRAACHTSAEPTDPSVCCPATDQCCTAAANGYVGGDLCAPAGEGCPIVCPGGAVMCGSTEMCALDATTSTYSCVADCNETYTCGDLCCPLGSTCSPDGSSCVLADLTIDEGQISSSYYLYEFTAQQGSCSFAEGCIQALGPRTVLRFDLRTPNIGDGDLYLGSPFNNELFQFSECHGHFHFSGYANYRLLDAAMNPVGTGRKQAFCLLDWDRYDPNAAAEPKYDCNNQGIQKGWTDTYEADLPCQYVDVTGVPPGDYYLEVVLNQDHTLGEKDYTNNRAVVPVTIP